MDIETFKNSKNKLIPYCISFFDGLDTSSFYLTDYRNPTRMMKECLSCIFVKQYHGQTIYIHNFSTFDAIFLLRVLSSFTDYVVTPLMRNEKILNIKVSYNKGKNYVNFRDSLLILPVSLANLAKAFKVEDKGLFPYSFPNGTNLNYIGTIPTFNNFYPQLILKDEKGFTQMKERYNEYSSQLTSKMIDH